MLNKLSVRRKILLVVAVPIITMLAIGAFVFNTQQSVRVGSQSYQEIIAAKDLIADVLPPPGFVVESYLTVQQLANTDDRAENSQLRARLETFEAEYEKAHQRWADDVLIVDSDIRASFIEDSFESGTQFFEIVNTRFMPLMDAGDQAGALVVANTELKDIYEGHRAAIVETVTLAQARQTAIEADTNSLVKQRSVLTIAAFLLGLFGSLVASISVARVISGSVRHLRDSANAVATTLQSADLDSEVPELAPVTLKSKDELADAAAAFNSVVDTAVDLLQRQARGRVALSETFVNLGRRNQNLVAKQLRLVDELERDEADTGKLQKLFKLDHLATRMRRNAESLLVMAGLEAPRKWKRSVPVHDVVRSAVSEVEQFDRVEVLDIRNVHVSGTAAANISHLMAELVENAVRSSPPDTAVVISSVSLADGTLRLLIEDSGTGMTDRDVIDANERLAVPLSLEHAPTGHLGHFVVSHLAARHGIKVRLRSPGGEGVTAEVDLPADALTVVEAQPKADTVSEREGYVRNRARSAPTRSTAPAPTIASAPAVATPAAAAAPAAPAVVPTPSTAATATTETPVTEQPAQPILPAPPTTAVAPDATPAEVTAAGYKKRTPKAADASGYDRFATPTQEARPRSAEATRNRLDNFKAGKTKASNDSTTPADTKTAETESKGV